LSAGRWPGRTASLPNPTGELRSPGQAKACPTKRCHRSALPPGGARIVQSVTTERHAALDLGQAFSRFRPMLKINELAWCHRSGVSCSRACGGQRMMKISVSSQAWESMGCRDFQERMATRRLNRMNPSTQREQNSRSQSPDGSRRINHRAVWVEKQSAFVYFCRINAIACLRNASQQPVTIRFRVAPLPSIETDTPLPCSGHLSDCTLAWACPNR